MCKAMKINFARIHFRARALHIEIFGTIFRAISHFSESSRLLDLVVVSESEIACPKGRAVSGGIGVTIGSLVWNHNYRESSKKSQKPF